MPYLCIIDSGFFLEFDTEAIVFCLVNDSLGFSIRDESYEFLSDFKVSALDNIDINESDFLDTGRPLKAGDKSER